MPVAATLTLTTPHQVTVNVTGLPIVTNTYSKSPNWSGADGWSSGTAGLTVTAFASGLQVTSTAAVGTINKTVTPIGGKVRRIRARVVLVDPEAPPVVMWVSDSSGLVNGPKRVISGTPVWIEGAADASVATTARLVLQKNTGAASSSVRVESVTFDEESFGAGSWWLTRTDSNGTDVLVASGQSAEAGSTAHQPGIRPSATGTATVVDREASLVGQVDYRVFDGGSGFVTPSTGAGGVLSTGYGVLHRVLPAAPVLRQVNVIDFSGTYRGVAVPLGVAGADLPVVPTAPMSSREGSLVLYFDTLDQAEAVAADLRTGEVCMLRQDEASRTAMDAYLVATSLEVRRALEDLAEPKWALTATYLETARGVA